MKKVVLSSEHEYVSPRIFLRTMNLSKNFCASATVENLEEEQFDFDWQ